MRKVISDILNQNARIDVVGTARNGKEAIQKTLSLHPDVITMDVEMPVMNGIEAVKNIMSEHPTPIVMVSALTSQGAKITLESLHAGAIDFICKPSGSISLNMKEIGDDLVSKVKAAATANVHYKKNTIMKPILSPSSLNVFLVDDSPFFLKKISQIISSERGMNIIGTAHDGGDAIQKLQTVNPDVVLMDINMPSINGVQATQKIFQQHQIPIIVISGETEHNMTEIKRALDAGAIDFIPKPAGNTNIHTMSELLIQKLRNVSKNKKQLSKKPTQSASTSTNVENLLVIGTSTGGPQTLTQLMPHIPKNINAGVLIVQHMPPVFTKSLAERLDSISSLTVKEAKEGDEIKNGEVLIAPGDYHMTVEEKIVSGKRKRYVSLNRKPKIHGVRPAVDVTFSTAADIFKNNVVAVILTGMGRDGAQAMGAIKAKGGKTIAQDEKTSIIFGMPKAAIELGVVDRVLPLHQIASQSSLWLKGLSDGGIAK
jgi:two-component system chemotaxis response regulator CheB